LFRLATNKSPFKKADDNDEYYKFLIDGRPELFWILLEKNKGINISGQLKDLLTHMLNPDKN
jgi:hypothetical protein